MESHASISADVLARYAADAALEVDGVHSLVGSHLPRHRPVRIAVGDDGRISVEVRLAAEWGASFGSVGSEVQARVAEYLTRMADVQPARIDVVVDESARPHLMPPKVAGLTGATLETAPSVCHECVWWQSGARTVDKRRWIQKAEEDWGAWGTVYYDADGRLLGSMQYGPSGLFPRAARLPGGPPSSEAVLVTCAYVVDAATPWVMQSLFLAAIGDAKDRGAKALEAFAYRYSEGESTYERFLVHRTVFPADFLADFGFRTVRAQGRVELARLELGGLVPVYEGMPARVFRSLKEALTPAPVPQRP